MANTTPALNFSERLLVERANFNFSAEAKLTLSSLSID